MKTIFKSGLLFLFVVLLNGCSNDDSNSTPLPTVDFTYSGANVPAPASVNFSSTTTNATSYLWDFGDNGSSTIANPQHLYNAGGVYTVKLTVTGSGGTNSITKTVNIGAALTKVKISKVTILNIPFTKPGGTSGWDTDGTGPDIYFQIQDQTSTILFNAGSASRISNVTPSLLPISWNITTPFEITNLSSPRFIQLFDYDTITADEDMSYVGFLMSDYVSGATAYPLSVTETQNGITLKLDLIWY
jgi:PKD repeat protein